MWLTSRSQRALGLPRKWNERRVPLEDADEAEARYNNFMELNQTAPDFELPDLQGNLHKLNDYHGRLVVVNFWSAECPHSERTDQVILDALVRWGAEVVLLPIASNRNESAQMVEEVANTRHIPMILFDAEHVVADLYEAVSTPQVFVIDREGILRYRGAVDDAKFRQPKPTRYYLEDVMGALLHGRKPDLEETLAYGCAIVREI